MPGFNPPNLDYHGLAPEIILTLVLAIVLVADLFLDRSRKWLLSNIASFGLIAAMVPILSLALSENEVRSMVGGAYVVDNVRAPDHRPLIVAEEGERDDRHHRRQQLEARQVAHHPLAVDVEHEVGHEDQADGDGEDNRPRQPVLVQVGGDEAE